MHVSASGNYWSLAFIGDLAFIITLASNLKVYHTYYRFYVNVKLLFSFYSMRWHQDSGTKQDNLQMYSSNRCPAECSVFGETATHGLEDTASNCNGDMRNEDGMYSSLGVLSNPAPATLAFRAQIRSRVWCWKTRITSLKFRYV